MPSGRWCCSVWIPGGRRGAPKGTVSPSSQRPDDDPRAIPGRALGQSAGGGAAAAAAVCGAGDPPRSAQGAAAAGGGGPQSASGRLRGQPGAAQNPKGGVRDEESRRDQRPGSGGDCRADFCRGGGGGRGNEDPERKSS